MKSQTLIQILTLILCLAPLPKAQALNPPPDGGYPGRNTAEGEDALMLLGTGIYNTGVGWVSLALNFGTSFNTATGAGTLSFHALSGDGNTANGAFALFNDRQGEANTAIGAGARQQSQWQLQHGQR